MEVALHFHTLCLKSFTIWTAATPIDLSYCTGYTILTCCTVSAITLLGNGTNWRVYSYTINATENYTSPLYAHEKTCCHYTIRDFWKFLDQSESHVVYMSDGCKGRSRSFKSRNTYLSMYWTTNVSPNEAVWRPLIFFKLHWVHWFLNVFVVDVSFPKGILMYQ